MGSLAQINIVDVNQELEHPLTVNLAARPGLLEGRRDVGNRPRHPKSLTAGG
jgi:hypothetical protein